MDLAQDFDFGCDFELDLSDDSLTNHPMMDDSEKIEKIDHDTFLGKTSNTKDYARRRLNMNGKDKDRIKTEYGFWHDDLKVEYTNKDNPTLPPTALNISLLLQHHEDYKNYKPCASEYYQTALLGDAPITDTLKSSLQLKLASFFGCSVSENNLRSAINACLENNTKNELQDSLERVSNVKPSPLFDNWLSSICKVEDTPLTRALGRKWLISGIARMKNPGCNYEGMLIIQGLGGIGKSYCFNILANALNNDRNKNWHWDDNIDLSNTKEIIEKMSGKFIIEFAEMKAAEKASANLLKSFVTSSSDKARAAYKEFAKEVPRKFILAGTSNDEKIITDSSESTRRWWCVSANAKIDTTLLQTEAKGLWRAALDAYTNGEQWWLTAEEAKDLDKSNERYRLQNNSSVYLEEIVSGIHEKVSIIGQTQLLDALKQKNVNISASELPNILKRMGWMDGGKKRYSLDFCDPDSDKSANPARCWIKLSK